MKKDYFEYPLPRLYELKEMYQSPYRFSEELRTQVDYIFLHPYNKYNKLYDKLHKEWDSNDMLKSAYLNARYFLDHPQQFAHEMDNIASTMIVCMWKAFLSLNGHLRGNKYDMYYAAKMKLIPIMQGKFYEMLLDDMDKGNIIMHNDDMVKRREGKGLREQNKASLLEGSKHFEYLCGLE